MVATNVSDKHNSQRLSPEIQGLGGPAADPPIPSRFIPFLAVSDSSAYSSLHHIPNAQKPRNFKFTDIQTLLKIRDVTIGVISRVIYQR